MHLGILASLSALLLAVVAPLAGAADGYPSRPIRMVVPFGPGGGTDINARILGDPLGKLLDQTVVVDNRPGAGSILGTEIVSNADPDGYTLLLSSISMTINAAVYKKLPFDIQRDFSPITLVSDQPNIMVSHPSLPARTFKEFAALVQSQPDKFTFGSPGAGTGIHLATELMLMRINAKLTHVPYKGTGPALIALLGNEISVYVSTFASALPHVRGNRLRAYGVTTAKRADPLPEVPTLAEAGLPGYDYATWYGLLAPAGTPKPVIDKLSAAAVGALNSAELRKIFIAQGLNATPTTPTEFAKYIQSEIDKWAGVVRAANIKKR